MRDPNRLYSFYDEMRKVHMRSFSDWRFGQLMSNFFGWLYTEKKKDCFFPEEDEMIECLREYANTVSPLHRGD